MAERTLSGKLTEAEQSLACGYLAEATKLARAVSDDDEYQSVAMEALCEGVLELRANPGKAEAPFLRRFILNRLNAFAKRERAGRRRMGEFEPDELEGLTPVSSDDEVLEHVRRVISRRFGEAPERKQVAQYLGIDPRTLRRRTGGK